ncbi:MAG: preprotein translocase subunit SecA [Gemmataceae bacterium]
MSAAVLEPHANEERPQSMPGRLGPMAFNQVKALVGPPRSRRFGKAAKLIPAIRYWEGEFSKLSDEDLKKSAHRVRGRARGGESLDKLLPEAFGLVCVASVRTLNMRPFDVQLAGGAVMHFSALAELATGEGKTLTASMPVFLNALTGKGVHVTTVNDYLAKRDAELIGPLYEMLGLSVGVLQMQMPEPQRKAAYQADVTYGMASEFGFDFLRDRMKLRGGQGGPPPFWAAWGAGGGDPASLDPRMQRDLHCALVDEADSIFIDEARTPLIIASPTRPATPEEQVVYHWANGLAMSFKRDADFTYDQKKDKIELTEVGKQAVRWSNPPSGEHSHAMDKLHEHVERAIHAHYRFARDQHYMVLDGKVVIVDEYTGRPMPDRHWREGLHQAVEAKEGAPITLASDHAAKITFQSYFKLYKKLAGMTGTAVQNTWEIRRVYKLWVVPIPTNMPVLRQQLPDRVFPTEDVKFDAVVTEVQKLNAAGRPVLIGTRSVEKSEALSLKLKAAGIKHSVLNAKLHEQEAEIVKDAGQRGKVTIATNMAGRGTDIKLGPSVPLAGGLAVIGTERHDARRVDRQLIGRSGRQGDPGSGQFFISLEDELLEALGHKTQAALAERGRASGNEDWNRYAPLFEKAQGRMERKHYKQRLDLLYAEKQRQETLEDLGADPYVD